MGLITFPDVKACYVATIISALWYWGWVESRSVEQNRELRGKSTYICSLSDKGEKQFK